MKKENRLKKWFYFKAARILHALIRWLYVPYSEIKSDGVDLGYWDPGVVSYQLAEMFSREIPLTGQIKDIQRAFNETTTLQGETNGK